jgi:hypothetical protein
MHNLNTTMMNQQQMYTCLYGYITNPNNHCASEPQLRKKEEYWRRGNPVSSFEFIDKVNNYLFKFDKSGNRNRDEFQFAIDNIIKNNESNYGKYIDSDGWSVYFTGDQLNNFVKLCSEVYLVSKCRALEQGVGVDEYLL